MHIRKQIEQPRITTLIQPRSSVTDNYNPFFTNRRKQKRTEKSTILEEVKATIIDLTAGTQLSYQLVASEHVLDPLRELIRIAQQHPDITPEKLLGSFTAKALSAAVHDKATMALEQILSTFHNQAVSVMFDSGTVTHDSIIAVTMETISTEAKPHVLCISHSPASVADYALFTEELLFILQSRSIQPVSICTDGLTRQISGITQVTSSIINGFTQKLTLLPLAPFHIPCMNHRINLVLRHAIKHSPFLKRLESEAQSFAANAAKKEYQTKLGKHCPVFIETRWLSLSAICSYIRRKRGIIMENHFLTADVVLALLKFELFLLPLTELQLFFEREETKLWQCFPAVIRTFEQYKRLLLSPLYATADWLTCLVDIVCLLFHYTLADGLGARLLLSFIITPPGRALLATSRIPSGYKTDLPILESIQQMFSSF